MQTVDANVSTIARTLQDTGEWLTELQEIAGLENLEQSYSVLRGVLLPLRDRLTTDEAADLSAQLPTLIRGVYYEQWKPSATPQKQRSKEEFCGAVNDCLKGAVENVDAEKACIAVFALLEKRLTQGAADHAREMLHKDIQEMWPSESAPQHERAG
jgi:uncharacterized protein (DUF2267 family)